MFATVELSSAKVIVEFDNLALPIEPASLEGAIELNMAFVILKPCNASELTSIELSSTATSN